LGVANLENTSIPAAQNEAISRRIALKICTAGLLFPIACSALAQTITLTPAQRAALGSIVTGDIAFDAEISLLIEPLAETGNAIPIRVASPRLEITRWVVVAEKNPRPIVFDAAVAQLAARSPLSTRIRLAATQNILALAQTRTGAWHAAQANVALTASACYDGT
jgi:sulfur-oxidizing protein SoxY